MLFRSDRDLQWATEDAITVLAKQTKATNVSAVIMDSQTGEILALATAPGFDPNDFSHTKASLLKVPSVQDVYEPGSTGKVMTMAAALEEKLVTMARKQTARFLSVREAIRMLFESGYLDKEQSYQIDRLRTFRNTLVHTPKKVTTGQIQEIGRAHV